MDTNAAAKILAEHLVPSLKYEYYSTDARARELAQALTVITGNDWHVRRDSNQPACYWVVKG